MGESGLFGRDVGNTVRGVGREAACERHLLQPTTGEQLLGLGASQELEGRSQVSGIQPQGKGSGYLYVNPSVMGRLPLRVLNPSAPVGHG